MAKYLPVLKECPLFAGIQEANIEQILPCLSASVRQAEKNTFIVSAEDQVNFVGLILSGSVHIVSEDFWGRKDILSQLGPGELFAESFSCAEAEHIPVSVIAVENTEVMLLSCRKLVTTCSSACVFHSRLISNMLQIIAGKNILLMQKIEQLSKRSTREKILAYLSSEAKKGGGNTFEIPFSRQEMADYLAVDRSAMSSELGRMRDEGLIDFDRNHFRLKESYKGFVS
nr:Crp/Fnr family transcriptional regulator [Sporobacter termitidis]